MSMKVFQIEEELKLLCIQMIEVLTKMKDHGILSEDQYQEHTRLKKMFLKDYCKTLI